MSIEDLVELKNAYDKLDSGQIILIGLIVDEMTALEGRINTLEEQMANRMLCKKYDTE